MTRLGYSLESREGLAYEIGNKNNLSPKRRSCVRCGLVKAIEALQTSGSTIGKKSFYKARFAVVRYLRLRRNSHLADNYHINFLGANVIIMSQGHLNVLSREDEKSLVVLAKKHELRLYTMPVVQETGNFSILFESLPHATGGNSFIIDGKSSPLSVYMGFIDALREIRSRSEQNGPSLVSFYGNRNQDASMFIQLL